MRWRRGRSDAASTATSSGADHEELVLPLVGHEDERDQARLAQVRGREAGAVRLPPSRALGLDNPAEKEIQALGAIRKSRARLRGIEEERDPRGRIKSADKREERARRLHGELNERLGRLRDDVQPQRSHAVMAMQRVVSELDRAYHNLPLVERGVPGLSLGLVEGLAIAVAFFDAVFMDNPLQKAGIVDSNARHLWVVAIAFVIWGSVHACGVYGGMLSLRLSTRDRRKAATLLILGVLGLLVLGLLMLGFLRHARSPARSGRSSSR